MATPDGIKVWKDRYLKSTINNIKIKRYSFNVTNNGSRTFFFAVLTFFVIGFKAHELQTI